VKLCLLILLALPLTAAKKPLTWEHAVIESIIRVNTDGGIYTPPNSTSANDQSIRESIYVDAGEWLYQVARVVTARGVLPAREGSKIDVAGDGKKLILRIGAKEYTTHIEHKSRAGRHVTDPASRR